MFWKQAFAALVVASCLALSSTAQVATPATSDSVVPMLTRFSGSLKDIDGNPLTTITGVTFLLYKDSEGGAPVWMETQNVHPDAYGRYTVTLGATTAHGLPPDLFASGEARWLGVQISGQAESRRTLLVSVPYALKAQDAATIGGLPPSAFVLANPSTSTSTGSAMPNPAVNFSVSPALAASPTAITGTGSVNFVPLWNSTTDIISSVLFQSGKGAAGKIGINTTTPASTLDVNGAATVRGTLSLPSINGTGGSMQITGGANPFGSSYGSSIMLTAGNAAQGGPFVANGGSINLTSGNGGGVRGNGGSINLTSGSGFGVNGDGGSINLTPGGGSGTNGNGGSINLTPGGGSGVNGDGGSIILTPGSAPQGGVPGNVQLWNYVPAVFYEDAGITAKGIVGPDLNGDLSLVSRTVGNWLRLGSNQGNIAFWTDGNAEWNDAPQMFLSTSALQVFGTCVAGNCSSDVRLKKNIRPLPPVLDKLAQLQPVSWDWRTDEYPDLHLTLGRNFGLIAQEVEKVFPELVSTDEHGFEAVNYSRFPLMLLQAVHELKAENNSLRSKLEVVEELKTENDSLRAKLYEQETTFQNQQAQIMQLAAQMRTLQAEVAANASSGKDLRTIAQGEVRP